LGAVELGIILYVSWFVVRRSKSTKMWQIPGAPAYNYRFKVVSHHRREYTPGIRI
jgi:hypothetical protein